MVIAVVVAMSFMVVFSKSVIVVPAGDAWIVERLGRSHVTLPPGLHVITPFTDRVAFRFSVQPREEEVSDQCVTRDNVPVRVTSLFRAQIANPERAAYASANAGDSVKTL
ncbi:MAG TPA: SPFH domain-containing protein, partial [Polyangiaceae bacterium]